MLWGRQALDLALDLARVPTLAEAMRTHPLPPDTLVLIRIAAGCPETRGAAVSETGLKPEFIEEACKLYLQQVLLAPDADDYRVLGVQAGASRSEMREHMRWLLKWLHPDTNQHQWDSVFAERVLKAWRAVGAGKLEGARSETLAAARPARSAAPMQRWVALPLKSSPAARARRRRILMAAIVGAFAIAVVLTSAFAPFTRLLSAFAPVETHGVAEAAGD